MLGGPFYLHFGHTIVNTSVMTKLLKSRPYNDMVSVKIHKSTKNKYRKKNLNFSNIARLAWDRAYKRLQKEAE